MPPCARHSGVVGNRSSRGNMLLASGDRGEAAYLPARSGSPWRLAPEGLASAIVVELPRASRVDLVIHDLAGRRVRTLIDGETRAMGRHTVRLDTDDLAPRV